MPTIYIKDYDTEVDIPEDADMAQVQAALQKQFPSKQQEAPVARKPETEVPEWGRKHPNLYGAVGATRETLGPMLEALGVGGGAVLGAPAGPLGSLSGAGLGYGGVKQGLSSVDALLGNKPETTPLQAPKDILTGATMEAAGPVIAKPVGAALRFAGKGARQLLGATTGSGPGMIEGALKGGKPFTDAMRGKVEGGEIVDNVRGALQALKEQRTVAYQSQLAKISENLEPIDITPVRNKMSQLLYNYGVRTGKSGGLNFERSTFGKKSSRDVAEIVDMVQKWGKNKNDNSPIMLDTLKRRLDDFYSDSSQARQFVSSLRNEVKDSIVKNVPEYAEMTKGYSDATRLIKDVETTLMAGKQYKTDPALRRLTSAMRENFEMRKDLVNILGEKAGQDLSGQISGYSASQIIPRGLVGKLFGGGAGYLTFLNPKFYPLLAASSPRAVGEFMNIYGKGLAEAKKIAPATYKTMAFGALNQ